MSDAQKYQKKKNILIILFMILLIVFVLIICGIVIYAKQNPPQRFLSPDEIEIKQMQVSDYTAPTNVNYSEIEESNTFTVTEDDQEYNLVLTGTKEIKIIKDEKEESIQIMQNDKNINNNIKLIYQTERESLILTETGELYKLIDKEVTDGQLKVGQILSNMSVKNIIVISGGTSNTYILNNEGKLINIDNLKEYSGIVKEIKTSTSTIYIYGNNYFGVEEGKIFVDENNQAIKIKISFDNKIISETDVIYEINAVDNSLSTSNLGNFSKIWYKTREDGSFDVTLMSSTGYKDFVSSYYYGQ